MGDEVTPQHSVVESDHSRSSEIALIEEFFPEMKRLDANNREKKYSRKYNVTKDRIEEKKNSFNWIGDNTEFSENEKEGKHKSDRKHSHNYIDPIISTMESDKTSSTCTASDFTSNVYSKNGYIRGTNDKKCGHDSTPMLKYNEFSSLVSSLGTGRNFPVEVKFEEKDARKKEDKPCLDEQNSTFLILGSIQMMLGILMAVFGVLVIAHDSSLSSAGSGLWGGAVAMFSGLMGILAGLKGCYSGGNYKLSRSLLTLFLALCLISFALSNLVVVLTSTGLIRDVQRPKTQFESQRDSDTFINWPPVLADVGLILAAALQCIATVFSGYKCYKKVCPCLRNDHNRLSDADSHHEKYKVEGKERLVNHWLGQQLLMPKKKGKDLGQNNMIPWGTPNIVLLPPPPPIVTNGQIPILTFLQAPSSVFGSSACGQVCSNTMPCCCRHENRYLTSPHPMVHDRRASRKINYMQPDIQVPAKSRSQSKTKKERCVSLPTAEEVARTYTGLDREIAEEFIAIAMDKGGKRSRHNSFAEYAIDSSRNGY